MIVIISCSITSVIVSILSVSSPSTRLTSIPTIIVVGPRCIVFMVTTLCTSGTAVTTSIICFCCSGETDSPNNNPLFSFARKKANYIKRIPMIIELIASNCVFPVMSVRRIPMAATTIPNNAAVSSTITVSSEVSLLFLNSE